MSKRCYVLYNLLDSIRCSVGKAEHFCDTLNGRRKNMDLSDLAALIENQPQNFKENTFDLVSALFPLPITKIPFETALLYLPIIVSYALSEFNP